MEDFDFSKGTLKVRIIKFFLIRMPHFGLMDPDEMKEEDASLLRARLHIRGGKRRLSQGKYAAGVAALHDALIAAMQWFILSSSDNNLGSLSEDDIDPMDEEELMRIINKSPGSVPSLTEESLAYLISVLNKALEGKLINFNVSYYLVIMEDIMKDLGVIPFSNRDNELKTRVIIPRTMGTKIPCLPLILTAANGKSR